MKCGFIDVERASQPEPYKQLKLFRATCLAVRHGGGRESGRDYFRTAEGAESAEGLPNQAELE